MFKRRLCLRFLQGEEGEGGKDSDQGFFFTGRGGEKKIFSRAKDFFLQGGRRRRFFSRAEDFFTGRGEGFRDPDKDKVPKGFFFPPRGFTVPTATSRLGQPTNGGNAGRGEKKAALAPGPCLGGNGGKVKKNGRNDT